MTGSPLPELAVVPTNRPSPTVTGASLVAGNSEPAESESSSTIPVGRPLRHMIVPPTQGPPGRAGIRSGRDRTYGPRSSMKVQSCRYRRPFFASVRSPRGPATAPPRPPAHVVVYVRGRPVQVPFEADDRRIPLDVPKRPRPRPPGHSSSAKAADPRWQGGPNRANFRDRARS